MKSIAGKDMRARRTMLFSLVLSTFALGGLAPGAETERANHGLSDLTFSNFLSVGWDETWTRRPRGEGTPNMSLLRVQTNFVTQVFRLDFADQENLRDAGNRRSDALTGTLEYAFNRRFMLALIGNYRWLDSRVSENNEGAAVAAFARVQWLDTATSSLAMTLRAGLPNRDLGEKETLISLSIAGWRDLAPLGLKRVGLYYHLQEETLIGPGKAGSRRNDLTYAVSLAKTWTSPESFFGNATTFLEAYGKTDLDGDERGHTLLTLTPGARATFSHRHIVMAGVEFPLTHPRPYEQIVRLTYIFNF